MIDDAPIAVGDRVMRFVPVFDSPDQATRFATEQALIAAGL